MMISSTKTVVDLIEMKQGELMSSLVCLTSCWVDEDSNA